MDVNIKLKKITIDKNAIMSMLNKEAFEFSNDVIADMKENAPVDDTTPKKAEYIYNSTGKTAWIKDDISSRDHWKLKRVKGNRRRVRAKLVNENPAVIALALGFISPLNKNAEPVERTPNGKFSEQSPKGDYVYRSLRRVMKARGYKFVKKKK